MSLSFFIRLIFLCTVSNFLKAENPGFKLSWPTPNPAFARGYGYSTFIQKTGPDKPFTSGSFGCVRNNGYKFHEGLDLYPLNRDKKGRATDSIFSAMSGTVSYINEISALSAYGKYLVIEHNDANPALYTLYAHLESIDKNLKIGTKVQAAQAVGKMGNTSSGYHIPLNRSHLHFEIGLRLTNSFQTWYNKKPFKSKNKHGNFSGFNLVGFDPLKFYLEYKNKSFKQPIDFIRTLPLVTTVRIKTSKLPDFVSRYPSLCLKKGNVIYGWDVYFGPYGIPLKMEQLEQPLTGLKNKIEIINFNSEIQKDPCRKLITSKDKQLYPTEQLKTYLELLFNL